MQYIYFLYSDSIRSAVSYEYKRYSGAIKRAYKLAEHFDTVEMWEKESRKYYSPDNKPLLKLQRRS